MKKSIFAISLIVILICSYLPLFISPAQSQSTTYLKTFEQKKTALKIRETTFPDSYITTASTPESWQFNVTLTKRPSGNSFSFPLETEGLEFYYQPPLDKMLNKKDYDLLNETHAIKNGKVLEMQPENVVGSYEAYQTVPSSGSTGKLYHIYRPLIIDANGAKIWGELSLSKTELKVTVDAQWLQDAAYPVVIDPTFGYTTAGADTTAISSGLIRGTLFTLSEAGTVTSGSAYIDPLSNGNVQMLIYKHSDLSLKAASSTTAVLSASAAGWVDFTFAGESLSADDYILCLFINCDITIYRTNNVLTDGYHAATGTPFTPPDPLTVTAHANHKMSIYATYTASGSGTPETVSCTLNSPTNASVITSYTQAFNYTPVLVGSSSFQNASLYVDGVSVANNASAIVNNTQNTISYTFASSGTYIWDVRVFNTTIGVFSSNGNFTLYVDVDETLSLTLDSPANASVVTEYAQNFNYTPVLIGSGSFRNATLYVNGSAVAYNTTAITNATTNTVAYTLPANGFYLWDIQVYNSTTAVWSSNGNFSLTVAVPESLSVVLNTPSNGSTVTTFTNSFTYTPTLAGSDSIKNATLYVNGSAVAYNASAITNGVSNSISYSFSENGVYLWDVLVYNSTHAVWSSNGNFTVTVNFTPATGLDITPTTINWGAITPGSNNTQTIYVTNYDAGPVNLTLTTSNWVPTDADTYMALVWDYNGTGLAQNETRTIILTLVVYANASALETFSFIITINGETLSASGGESALTVEDAIGLAVALPVVFFGAAVAIVYQRKKKRMLEYDTE